MSPNHLVSGDAPGSQFAEVWISANPQNERELVACGMTRPVSASHYHSRTVVYKSKDGGSSWRRVYEATGSDEATDPTCEFSQDGTLYFSTLRYRSGAQPYNARTEIYSAKGNDSLSLLQSVRVFDRGYLTPNRWKGGAGPEIVLHGTTSIKSLTNERMFAVAAYPKASGSRAFEEPRIAVVSTPGRRLEPGHGLVLKDGHLGFVQTEKPPYPENRGNRAEVPEQATLVWLLVKPEEATATQSSQIARFDACTSILDSGFPMAAIDTSNGPFSGRIYVTWTGEALGRCRIYLSSSDDEGTTWSKAIIIDGAAESYAKDRWNSSMPSIAVNNNGVLAISWYDRTGITNQLSRTTNFAASLDGGATFLPSVTASSKPADYSKLAGEIAVMSPWDRLYNTASPRVAEFGIANGEVRGGETAGITADATGKFHLLWVDNRTGVSEIWTSVVDVDGTASPGAPDLMGAWRDVTSDVVIEYSHAKYNPATKTVSVLARVSTSAAYLKGKPVTVRVTRAASPFGDVHIVTSSNEQPGVYEFLLGSETEGGRFVSQNREIKLVVQDEPKFSRELAGLFTISFLKIEARIYID